MNIGSATKKILNDPRYIEAHDQWFSRLQNIFDGRQPPASDPFHLLGIFGSYAQADESLADCPDKWVVRCLENLAEQAKKSLSPTTFTPLCLENTFPLYGVHFIDKIFGCEVFFHDGQWYNHYLPTGVGSLRPVDLDTNPTWQLAESIAKKFVAENVSVPLFGLPTIASALNIAVNLYGEEILAAMLAEPAAARHDLKIINDTLCEIHRRYQAIIPPRQLQSVVAFLRAQPSGYGQICGCTTQLISGDTYERFILPLDDELLGVYRHGGMIHYCGTHTHLLGALAKMHNLRAIQLNDRAAADLKLYREALPDTVIYLNPCEQMTIEQAMGITANQRLVIVEKLEVES